MPDTNTALPETKPVSNAKPITWRLLTQLEPRLLELEEWSRNARVDLHVWRGCFPGQYFLLGIEGGKECHKCRGGIRNHLDRLIGWHRPDQDPLLSSSEAWRVAVAVLYFKTRSRAVLGIDAARRRK